MGRIWNGLLRVVGLLWAGLAKVWFFFFGAFTWKLPPWLAMIGSFFREVSFRLYKFKLVAPKKFYLSILTTLLIGVGGVGGYLYYKRLPKPELVTSSCSNPAAIAIDVGGATSVRVI